MISTCYKCNIILNNDNWLSSRQKQNRKICKSCIRQDNNNRYQIKKEQYLKQLKVIRQEIKNQIFNYYGKICQICGENNFNKLSLDHIDGNGRRHREEILGVDSGTAFYKWVLKNKPNNLRLLCFNCNCQVDMTKKNNIRRNKYIDLKLQVFAHYGNKCKICQIDKIEYLTMDHINNDGAQHRRNIGTQIFPWIKRNNYPDNFQILCFNCNYLKRLINIV